MKPRHWVFFYVVCFITGLIGVLALGPHPHKSEAPSACRKSATVASACIDGASPTMLTAELAGGQEIWRCQMERQYPAIGATMGEKLDLQECVELRMDKLRNELTAFDQGFFIPLYACLSLLLVFLSWSLERQEYCAASQTEQEGWAWVKERPAWLAQKIRWVCCAKARTATLLAMTTFLLIGMDLRENHAALDVMNGTYGINGDVQIQGLERLSANIFFGHPPKVNSYAALNDLAKNARSASLEKWAVSAVWAGLLGFVLWRILSKINREWTLKMPTWVAAAGPLFVGIFGCLPLAVGAIAGMFDASMQWLVRSFTVGMLCAFSGLAITALIAAYSLYVLHKQAKSAQT